MEKQIALSVARYLSESGHASTLKKFLKECDLLEDDSDFSSALLLSDAFKAFSNNGASAKSKRRFNEVDASEAAGGASEAASSSSASDASGGKKKKDKFTAEDKSTTDSDKAEQEEGAKDKKAKKAKKSQPEEAAQDVDMEESSKTSEKKSKKAEKKKQQEDEEDAEETEQNTKASSQKTSKKEKDGSAAKKSVEDEEEQEEQEAKQAAPSSKSSSKDHKVKIASESTVVGGGANGEDESTATALKSNPTKKESKSASRPGTPFQRVKPEEAETLHPLMRNNSFRAQLEIGAVASWGAKANDKLIVTRGKRFQHEKNKGKRGNYRGGELDNVVRSHKFE